jgi:hypothetical protein
MQGAGPIPKSKEDGAGCRAMHTLHTQHYTLANYKLETAYTSVLCLLLCLLFDHATKGRGTTKKRADLHAVEAGRYLVLAPRSSEAKEVPVLGPEPHLCLCHTSHQSPADTSDTRR